MYDGDVNGKGSSHDWGHHMGTHLFSYFAIYMFLCVAFCM